MPRKPSTLAVLRARGFDESEHVPGTRQWRVREPTRHRDDCRRVFGRLDAECPRCQQLAAGAPARRGWGARRRAWEAETVRAIRAHDFAACARVNVVCTHFDW